MTQFGKNTAPQSFSSAERLARLRLIRSENVGPITFRQLISRFKTGMEALERLPELARHGGKKSLKICAQAAAEKELERTEKAGFFPHFWGEAHYSIPLAATEDAPPVFFSKGHRHLLDKPTVAMVGARNASAAGMRFAEKLARDLGSADRVIVSGLARGIDTAAHKGALETGTIAVLAGGPDVIYPRENQQLYDQIIEQGLIISEMPLGTTPQASHFPRRNRIISGLSYGVVVVEANMRSGSLITARLAGEQGREVFAVPGSPMDPRCHGPNSLIRNGAVLVESARDILESLEAQHRPQVFEPPELPFDGPNTACPNEDIMTAARTIVYQKLSQVPVDVDELVRQCGLAAPVILVCLLELEVAGQVMRHPGNKVTLA